MPLGSYFLIHLTNACAGVPMVVQLFGATDPTQIAPMLKHTAVKFETGGTYFLLLELKYALDTAHSKYTFATQEQV